MGLFSGGTEIINNGELLEGVFLQQLLFHGQIHQFHLDF